MKILVFGKTGQVATELGRYQDVTALSREQADLTDPAACAAIIAGSDADVVINAAAYTAVDRAEEDRETAMMVNAASPTAMAEAAAARAIPFVHISTDYVFDGSGETPWNPQDATGPLGIYGASKLAGEVGVRGAGGTYAIVRTAWVFSANGNNFVKTMLRLGGSRDRLTVVADQIGGPTSANAIAHAVITMGRTLLRDPACSGTYHFSGTPDVSWADFAREIFTQANMDVHVEDIPSSAYPTPAARPMNSRLDCSATKEHFDIARPDWRADLRAVLADLNSGNQEDKA